MTTEVKVKKVCIVCGKEIEITLPKDKYDRWQGGELIQNVFPEMTPTERERLISGVCSDECWDKLWGEEED